MSTSSGAFKLDANRAMTNQPLLIAFGPLNWLGHDDQRHHISGETLFEELTRRNVWYSSRSISIEQDTVSLFYLKRRGVIGAAVLSTSEPIGENDRPVLSRYGITYFRTKLTLKEVRRIEPIVALKPILDRLTFVRNKGNHWGTALRTTPRYIPRHDFDLIMSLAGLV